VVRLPGQPQSGTIDLVAAVVAIIGRRWQAFDDTADDTPSTVDSRWDADPRARSRRCETRRRITSAPDIGAACRGTRSVNVCEPRRPRRALITCRQPTNQPMLVLDCGTRGNLHGSAQRVTYSNCVHIRAARPAICNGVVGLEHRLKPLDSRRSPLRSDGSRLASWSAHPAIGRLAAWRTR
jgi:hypothetical protein